MIYCKRCLYPANHPLNLVFDSEGICSGCRVHEEKDMLDWSSRWVKLESLVSQFKKKGGIYDCIIPVSGARDSYFIVDTVKNRLGLHPLLVSYNKQYNTPVGIRNLAYLRTLLGCDFMSSTVNPETVKRVTRQTLGTMGSMYWHVLAGQTVFPVQLAVRLKVPLIIWGVHQGCDQVGMFSHLDEVEMTRKYRKNHDLMGFEAEDLIDRDERLSLKDLEPYRYPSDKEIERVGVRGIYLSNYIRWDSKSQHESMIDQYGYKVSEQQRTFDTYNDIDCFHYQGVHDYIKFLKWGYGKASDHATREIRLKRLSRQQGIELVRKHQTAYPYDLDLFLSWIGMASETFFSYIDRHRDPAIWSQEESGKWILKDSISNHSIVDKADGLRLPENESCRFRGPLASDLSYKKDQYILIGRGWDS